MKKILYVICIIVIAFSLVSCGTNNEPVQQQEGVIQPKTADSSPNWQKILERNELRVGVPGTGSSFYNELIDAFSMEFNIPVTKVKTNSDFKALLEDGTIDMYWGLYPKEASDSFDFTFSSPYVTTTAMLVTLESFGDEPGSVGVIKNSAEAVLAEGKYKNIKAYGTVNELWNALSYGNVNAIVINNCDYENSAQASSDKFAVKDTLMYNLVIAFKDGYTDVAAEVDKALAKIKASGIASEISSKWYGKDLISK